MLRPACLPGPPGWLRPGAITCLAPRLLRSRVTPAFDAVRRRAALGVRLEGRTGNLPSSGLSPDQFTTGSEAARRAALRSPPTNYVRTRRPLNSEEDEITERRHERFIYLLTSQQARRETSPGSSEGPCSPPPR